MAFAGSSVVYSYAPAATAIGTPLAESVASTAIHVNGRPAMSLGITEAIEHGASDYPAVGSGESAVATKMPTWTLPFKLDAFTMADFFFSHCQNIVSEGAGAPFVKVIQPAAVPSSASYRQHDYGDAIATEEPHFLDIWRKHLGDNSPTDKDIHAISGIPSQITLSFSNGFLTMTVTMIFFDADIKAVTYTGTITYNQSGVTGRKYIPKHATFVKINGTAYPIEDLNLTFTNGAMMHAYNYTTPQGLTLNTFGATASITMGMNKAQAAGIWTAGDPIATPGVQGYQPFAEQTVIVYGPRTNSDTPATESDFAITLKGRVIPLDDLGSGDDDVRTRFTLAAWYNGTNPPWSLSVADNINRAWLP